MTCIRLLVLVFLIFHLICDLKAYKPAPEMDVDDVLAARHFAGFTYQHSQHQGNQINSYYMNLNWPNYPFRLHNSGQDDPHAGAIFRNGRKLIVVFRGSDTVFDWWCDFKAQKRDATCIGLSGYVHTGFSEMFELLSVSLRSALLHAQQDANGPCEYILTGHSLGGALSMLGAGNLAADRTLFPNGVLENQLKVVNFSAPNIGDLTLSKHIENLVPKHNILCFANEADLVPYVPPTKFNWYSRTGIWICIKPDEHLLGLATDYAQTFHPRNLRMVNIKTKLSEALSMAAIYKWAPSLMKKAGLVAFGGDALIKMHAVPEEGLVKRKFLEVQNIAICLEDYEKLEKLIERESTSNLIKSFFRENL